MIDEVTAGPARRALRRRERRRPRPRALRRARGDDGAAHAARQADAVRRPRARARRRSRRVLAECVERAGRARGARHRRRRAWASRACATSSSRRARGSATSRLAVLDRPRRSAERGLAVRRCSPGAARRAAGILDGEPLEVRQDKLRARVAPASSPSADAHARRRVPRRAGRRAVPRRATARALRAARAGPAAHGRPDARARGRTSSRAECAAQPGAARARGPALGRPRRRVQFVDAALRDRSRPAAAGARARAPRGARAVPRLWAERGVQEIRLARADAQGERAARARRCSATASTPSDDRARSSSSADGNAFYLEELIRAVAEGKGDALPETVLAMVQARLEALDAEARRRAARGERVRRGVLAGRRGRAARRRDAGGARSRELARRARRARAAGARGRAAGSPARTSSRSATRSCARRAYAMLTEADRILGHRLAGAWLEQQGESDPMVLAEHFERGGEPARAGSFRTLISRPRSGRCERAIRSRHRAGPAGARAGPAGRRAGRTLLARLSEVHVWRGEWEAAARCGEQAMRLASAGLRIWARG